MTEAKDISIGNTLATARKKKRLRYKKLSSELNIEESAMLVGMLQNSSYYDPFRRTEITKNRRNLVFNQMEKNGFIHQRKKIH